MTTFKIDHRDGGYTEITTPEPMSERNLDGIYLRVQVDGSWESRCLTDMPIEIVEHILDGNARGADDPTKYMMSAVRHLHKRLRAVGDQFDLIT